MTILPVRAGETPTPQAVESVSLSDRIATRASPFDPSLTIVPVRAQRSHITPRWYGNKRIETRTYTVCSPHFYTSALSTGRKKPPRACPTRRSEDDLQLTERLLSHLGKTAFRARLTTWLAIDLISLRRISKPPKSWRDFPGQHPHTAVGPAPDPNCHQPTATPDTPE